MKRVAPEFSRPLPVDRVSAGGSYERITAEPGECEAVAQRLGVPRIASLTALLKASPWRDGLKVTGAVEADVELVSVVSLEPFLNRERHDLVRYFISARSANPEGDEDADVIEGGIVDLGEIAVETLALELNPYPRRPGEEFAVRQEDDPQAPASPFADLARIKPSSN